MSQNNCPKCHKEPAIDHPTYGILPGEKCKARDTEIAKRLHEQNPEFLTLTMHDRITSDRDRHEKDIIQPVIGNKPNPDFAKAYPELAHDYFSDEELEAM